MKLKTILILSFAFCFSHVAKAAEEMTGQCIQILSTSPVYDFTFKMTSDTGTGLLSVNAVPWKHLTCVRRHATLECTNPEKYIVVNVGATESASVLQDGRELITLSCKIELSAR